MDVHLCLLAAFLGFPLAGAVNLRLAGGPGPCAGRVEVFHQSRWGTVCDDRWDMNDAQVVCRELQCGTAIRAPTNAWFGQGLDKIWLHDVNCKGTEKSLLQCPKTPWGKHSCDHTEDASVVCSEVTPAVPSSKKLKPDAVTPFQSSVSSQDQHLVRLVGGLNRCSGRVEVFHMNQWGTVCDDEWDVSDAAVVCRQLGCGRALAAYISAKFGPGAGKIWLDGVQCTGEESSLAECRKSPWGVNNCEHTGDASIICEEAATCSTVVCEKNLICKMVDGKPQCVSDSVASCWASGDPHYRTFDGKKYDFQGTCTYTIAKSCGVNSQLPEFSVEAKNKNRGNTRVSYVSVVTVLAYNHNITMVAHEVGRVRVDGIISYLPIFLNGTMLHIYQYGENIEVKADFGLRVLYDSYSRLRVELSGRYSESVCGMCGNNNKDPKDDVATPDGKQAANLEEFGKSWKVDDGDEHCWSDCNGPCKTCPQGLAKKYQDVGFCGLIAKETDGPFIQCHATHDPKGFLDNCVYDVCLNGGSKREACEALKAYADVCQRDGVVITDWRKPAKCPLKCGPNSQYKVCGSACPNTCEGGTASTKCSDPCVEGCECNAGFMLSQGKCVPKSTCGCTYKGFPYAQNQVFWADDKCKSQCTCDPTTKQVKCKPYKCKASEKCSIVNGVRGCHPVSYGTCLASGDPHYVTFDKKRFDFQGTCVYMFSELCDKSQDLVDYQVHVQNNHRGRKDVSYTKVVTVIVYGMNFTMDTRYPGRVMVNSTLINLPFYTGDNNVIAYKAFHDVVLITKFGMKVTFDCKSRITATLPSTYAGAVCGLCGDFNGDQSNDLTLKDGGISANPTAFGDSWKVRDIPGCKVNESPPVCRNLKEMEEQQRKYETDCGVPLAKEGPFRDCHSKVDPEGYFKDCIFDSCFFKGRQAIVCQILEAYAAACQAAGATVYPWRTNTFCPLICLKNSHYEVCATGCPITCDGLTSPVGCVPTCSEGCTCNDGFVLSGDQCVDMSQCGCVYNGQYYTDNQVFYPDGKCDQQCTCSDGGVVTCTPFSCGPNEECILADGIQKCRPVGSALCHASGYPHYTSFDGLRFDFQGNCTYTLAKPCGGDKNLTAFAVHVTNRKWGNGKVTVTRRVDIEVYNYMLSMIYKEKDLLVNGVHYKLTVTFLNGKLKAVKQGTKWSMETDFGLKVQYDMNHHVSVTISANYKGEMCGLCGNYNGDKADEFLLPDGQLTTDVNTFGQAWTVPTDEICNPDICGPSNPCVSCDDKKNKVFSKKEYCGFLTDADGPLSDCFGTIEPDDYFKDCVYDLCAGNGDITMLCQNIEAYVAECQAAGVTMKPWRSDSFCPMSCPANSSYKTCTHICDASCFGLVDPEDCPDGCAEGCECDEDYFFDGEQCVTMDQCGCYENGRYYPPNVTILGTDCTESCSCSPAGGLFCEDHSCNADEKCEIEDGIIKATCLGFALSESQFQVRLKNGDSVCSGRVEVYMDGSWGNICDDGWDLFDANVVCRQLGCGPAREAYSSAKYGSGLNSDPIFMKNVECSGTENSLAKCQYEENSDDLCDHTEDAGVGCEGTFTKMLSGVKRQQQPKRKEKERKKNIKDQKNKEKRKKKESLDIRLVNGPNDCSGRLEVNYNGQWGTVCDDQWDVLDAKVACKQLGCGRPVDANKCDLFGAGSGPIWLDEVKCTGKEETLAKCMANKKGVHNCTHQEDVGLVCLEPMKFRLVDGPKACSGRLEVYYKGEWGTVCNDKWDLNDADVVCRELACGNAEQHEIVRLRFGKASGRIWLDDVDCKGDEKSLEHCKHRIWGYNDCTHMEDVSVICSGSSAP